jgi:putative hemolysin
MKPFTASIIFLLALTACAAPQPQTTVAPAATVAPQIGLANPASVYCGQSGNKLEIRTAADGSQIGICVFPDGASCEEWAYFRGECGPAVRKTPPPAIVLGPTTSISDAKGGYMPPGTSEKIADWWGIIKRTPPGAQFDDYFERQDLGQKILFGIDAADPVVQAQIHALRDSGRIVHLYGTLFSNVPDYNGSQIKVDRIELER